MFYTDWGVLPRAEALAGESIDTWNTSWLWHPSLLLLTDSVVGQALWFALAGVAAVALLVGYKTRLATILAWFLVLSLHIRNPLILSGGDALLCLLLFWGMFLPLGAWWSIDRLRDPAAARTPARVCSVGTQAVMFQVCFMYLIASTLKFGPEWHDGMAVYYALNLDAFAQPFGRGLLTALPPGALTLLTHAVMMLERIAPWWLLCPVAIGPSRAIAVAVYAGLQLGLGASLRLGLFPWISSVAMLPFLPTWWWERLQHPQRQPQRQPVPVIRTGRWANGLAAAALIYIGCWELGAIAHLRRYQGAGPLNQLGSSLRLGQMWSMFAPYPDKHDGWFVIPGRLADGRVIDLFGGGKEVSWEKPASVLATFKNSRWQVYMERLLKLPTAAMHRLYFSAYLCRDWNAGHQGPDQLQDVTIYFMQERTLPGSRVAPIERVLVWKQSCFVAGQPLLGGTEPSRRP